LTNFFQINQFTVRYLLHLFLQAHIFHIKIKRRYKNMMVVQYCGITQPAKTALILTMYTMECKGFPLVSQCCTGRNIA